MARRKGMGKGKGMGYKNIQPRDPKVHSDSSKGRKQPQRIPKFVVIEYDKSRTNFSRPLFRKDALELLKGTKKQHQGTKIKSDILIDTDGKGFAPMTLKQKMEVTKNSNLKDSDKDGVGDVIDCKPQDATKQDIVIKTGFKSMNEIDWNKLSHTERLDLLREAYLDDNLVSKPLQDFTVRQVEELEIALQRRKHLTKDEQKKLRIKNLSERQERFNDEFATESDKAKGIKQYRVVPPAKEIKRLVNNLIEKDKFGNKILKMPSAYGDFKVDYIFKGFTKSGNVILEQIGGTLQGGKPDPKSFRKRILKPYVYSGDVNIKTGSGTGTQILDLQTGR